MDERIAARLIGEPGKFLDVGAGDEATLLRRDEYRCARAVLLESAEQLIELLQDTCSEHVGGGSGLVQGEPCHTFGIALELPGAGAGVVHVHLTAAFRPPMPRKPPRRRPLQRPG